MWSAEKAGNQFGLDGITLEMIAFIAIHRIKGSNLQQVSFKDNCYNTTRLD